MEENNGCFGFVIGGFLGLGFWFIVFLMFMMQRIG